MDLCLEAIPCQRHAGLDPETAPTQAQSEDALNREPPGPRRRPGIPRPSTLPRMRRDCADVCGEDIRLGPMALDVLSCGGLGDRVEPLQHARGALAILERCMSES